MGKYLKLADD